MKIEYALIEREKLSAPLKYFNNRQSLDVTSISSRYKSGKARWKNYG